MRQRPRGRYRLGEAPMAVVRTIGPLIAVVLERDERTGGRAVRGGQPSVRHPVDDTCGTHAHGPRLRGILQAFDTPIGRSDTANRVPVTIGWPSTQ